MPAMRAFPNALNFSAASAACALCKQWGEVLGVFEEMVTQKVVPNAACFNDIVVVGAKTGQWEELLATLEKMAAAGITPRELEVIEEAVATAARCRKEGKELERLRAVLTR